MNISEQGLALIRTHEGFSATPYLCPAGRPTIGYGHLIKSGECYDTVTQAQAEALLQQDAQNTADAVSRLITIPITQNQFDAIVSLTYNIGVANFEKSTLLQLLNESQPALAQAQFSRWVYAGGQKLPGLIARRAAEAALFGT